ncbi:hypothetical protein SAMN05661096_00302 [Marivirga sericea]|uniref:Uncharacterized protein n=1 Tax=Marivirga sericea TaxID=1028 RepID=A0A1X7I8E5_9BACT|nr:hypothetical protein [Marivirga sericea]SMG10225.1 hypothetical protein SAMN05661096_00302 [Marivirga sericea]
MDTHENSTQEPVNFIHQFLSAMDKISDTPEMNTSHVSLYIGLFTIWNYSHFKKTISISRKDVMNISRIGSKHTYYKCLKDLHRMGFLKYSPSRNPMIGSLIEMTTFSTSTEQAVNNLRGNNETSTALVGGKSGTSSEQVLHQLRGKSGTSSEQVLHPYINNTNYINNKQYIYEKNKNSEKEKTKSSTNSRASAPVSDSGKNASPKGSRFTPPSKKELKAFFEQQTEKYSIPVRLAPVEAEKFFNYYSAKGWKVGSKSPMKDWKAAVRNWLLNFKKFNGFQNEKNEAGKLHNKEDKRYDIPL